MYQHFGLTLMVNHACNLRCSYCYNGDKFFRPMLDEVGTRAIDRAMASLRTGGTLELGFFGGEPLLEAERIRRFIDYAALRARAAGIALRPGLTTNGTITTPAAWSAMTLPGLDLAISCDGLPEVHDMHRRFPNGRESSDLVLVTLRALIEAGEDFRVVMAVRPDTASFLPKGVEYLQRLGVRWIEPTLDLWTCWRAADLARLEAAIVSLARIWRDGLPRHSITWFDEKAAFLAGVARGCTARCAFGCGEIAVAPSGRLYPCERLIGGDDDLNPMRLPGHVTEGANFLGFAAAPEPVTPACTACKIRQMCDTFCRCSNYIRTGRVDRPDGLLCLVNKVCVRETRRVLREMQPAIAHAGHWEGER